MKKYITCFVCLVAAVLIYTPPKHADASNCSGAREARQPVRTVAAKVAEKKPLRSVLTRPAKAAGCSGTSAPAKAASCSGG